MCLIVVWPWMASGEVSLAIGAKIDLLRVGRWNIGCLDVFLLFQVGKKVLYVCLLVKTLWECLLVDCYNCQCMSTVTVAFSASFVGNISSHMLTIW